MPSMRSERNSCRSRADEPLIRDERFVSVLPGAPADLCEIAICAFKWIRWIESIASC